MRPGLSTLLLLLFSSRFPWRVGWPRTSNWPLGAHPCTSRMLCAIVDLRFRAD